ncbi:MULTISPECIES: hypothetical protein [unclassified Leifsonia]|uniref:hypothetical protein n=1 Tax=unclassified Leifsonia TaxID=2663824 RepID=UPI0006FD5824|nr:MULTISPECIES: hypothetical protein [unclassified Leifsonia]KQX05739.1 hypothetical protein ASC59_16880 [Leifsonia sp. Root1293]KRA09375.1 hypothetical protein ASD61_16875 [Leifsonia sp. Root60]
MIAVTIVIWLLLVLVLGAGATFAVIAFLRPDRVMTWAAAGSLAAAFVLAWLAMGQIEPLLTIVVVIGAMALAVFGGGPAAVLALDLATKGTVRTGVHGGILVEGIRDGEATGREILRGGQTIGVLERFATVATIIAGFPEGLAIVVAVKGVGRFTELESSEARERFIIGTMASLIWACLCGAIVHLALS